MITPCLFNELSKKWGPPLATPVRKICTAGDNGASQQSAAKCAVTLTLAGTAPALCAMLAVFALPIIVSVPAPAS